MGHTGHTDKYCRAKIRNDLEECKKQLADLKKEKKSESVNIAVDTSDEVHPSYYDTAFSATTSIPCDSIFDTGSTAHMFKDISLLHNPTKISPTRISVASEDGEIWATHQGSTDIGSVRLSNVLYSSKLTNNLISVGRLCDSGFEAVFRRHVGYIRDRFGRTLIRMKRDPQSSRLWHLITPTHEQASLTTVTKSSQARLWHLRLGHAHPDAVIKAVRIHDGVELTRQDFGACDEFSEGKSSQIPSTSHFHRSPSVLDLVHSDIIGPIHPPTVNGNKYILTFIDDHTRLNSVFLLKHKSEAFEKFKIFKLKSRGKQGEQSEN